MRVLDFSDGFSSSTEPTTGNVEANSLKQFATTAAFVTDKGSVATDGDVFYNTTSDNINLYANGAWIAVTDDTSLGVHSSDTSTHGVATVAGLTEAQTLTNKSIDADTNTITNIENADIKAAAGIAVSKLAAVTASKALVSDASGFVSASSVTSTELGYLSGATSNIQTQINGLSSTGWVIQSKTTTYTAVANDFIKADATSGTFTITLPAASSNSGARIVIQKTDSGTNVITIARAGADTIQGATSITLNNQYTVIELVSDGTSLWSIKSHEVSYERISSSITAVTATTAADTRTDVTGGSIVVPTGKWKIGYKVAARIQRIGTTGEAYGRINIEDPTGAIMEQTISIVGNSNMAASESLYGTNSAYQIVDVTTTGTYKLQITANGSSATQVMHIIANTYGFFSGADADSEIYAERIK